MQVDQWIRRQANRTRRRLQGPGAGLEPLVEIEGAPLERPRRRRSWRLAAFAVGGLILAAVLARAALAP